MDKLFITDPKKLLLAIAQVIEDHPKVHTSGVFARDKRHDKEVFFDSIDAACFCAAGMMKRLVVEGTTNARTEQDSCVLFLRKTGFQISTINDVFSRKELVKRMREAAK